MIDLIPGMQFSDSEKQLYGSIAGAILGALVGALAGALSTFVIGNRERKKQEDLQKIQQNRAYMRSSIVSIQSIGLDITDILLKCQANNEYAEDIQQGLIKQDANKFLALMQASTPFEYAKPDKTHTHKILNDRIATLWSNLCQEIELQNKNINDFADYYKMLFDTIHTALLKGEHIDVSIVQSDNQSVLKAMEQQFTSNNQLRKKCIDILAYINCFKTYRGKVDARAFTTLQQNRTYIEDMAAYEPTAEEYKKAWDSEDSIFDPGIMFKSKSTGDQDTTAPKDKQN